MTASKSQANAPAAARGFPGLSCILCGAEDGISLDLSDASTFHCGECGEDFNLDTARIQAEQWLRVCDWVSTCPAQE